MPKKPLTEEDQQRRAERLERFRAMARKLGSLSPDQRLNLFSQLPVIHTVEGRSLSPHNTALVVWQSSTPPVMVGGFRQWKSLGRSVKKGEHGLMIWIPCKPKNEDDLEASAVPDEMRFIMGTVFELNQTEERGVDNDIR